MKEQSWNFGRERETEKDEGVPKNKIKNKKNKMKKLVWTVDENYNGKLYLCPLRFCNLQIVFVCHIEMILG